MTDIKLKPCPFCGSPAYSYHDNCIDFAGVKCDLGGCVCADILITENNWNTRPIEDALTARIAELEAAQRWIPVSERLPECEKDVLVFWGKASDGSKIDWFGTAWRNECDDGKWCTDPIVPTHWMPLPEPPIVYGKVCEE